jgi:quercetin dioxygenase-like cupin family protein
MNLKDQHSPTKSVSAALLFQGGEGTSVTLQILKDQQLKEHLTKVPALLVCVQGQVVFENEKGVHELLASGDFIHIEPMVNHWVNGIADSQLLLLK